MLIPLTWELTHGMNLNKYSGGFMEKVMSLKHLYSKRYRGQRWGAATNRKVFGNGTKLPAWNVHDNRIITLDDGTIVALYLMAGKKGKRVHRVFVDCWKCKCFVPTGRVHQHVCKGDLT